MRLRAPGAISPAFAVNDITSRCRVIRSEGMDPDTFGYQHTQHISRCARHVPETRVLQAFHLLAWNIGQPCATYRRSLGMT